MSSLFIYQISFLDVLKKNNVPSSAIREGIRSLNALCPHSFFNAIDLLKQVD